MGGRSLCIEASLVKEFQDRILSYRETQPLKQNKKPQTGQGTPFNPSTNKVEAGRSGSGFEDSRATHRNTVSKQRTGVAVRSCLIPAMRRQRQVSRFVEFWVSFNYTRPYPQ